METDEYIGRLEARVASLERQVEILTCVLSGMDVRKGAAGRMLPSVESLLKPYHEKVYVIGREILGCYSREQFERIRAKYRTVLSEVRGRFSDEVFRDFMEKKNAQLLKCYDSVKYRWLPTEERERVLRREVPLGRDVDYEPYFPSSREAFAYIIANAGDVGEAREAAAGVCKGYAGLNEAFYVEYVGREWEKAHGASPDILK